MIARPFAGLQELVIEAICFVVPDRVSEHACGFSRAREDESAHGGVWPVSGCVECKVEDATLDSWEWPHSVSIPGRHDWSPGVMRALWHIGSVRLFWSCCVCGQAPQ